MLRGLGGSINGVGNGELVTAIHELCFKNEKIVGSFGGGKGGCEILEAGFITHCHRKLAG